MVDIGKYGLEPCEIRSVPIGARFGRLTVLAFGKKGRRNPHLVCMCDCGVLTVTAASNVKNGTSKSCGCLRKEKHAETNRKRLTTHGLSYHRLWSTWRGMMQRCYNDKHRHFARYGGRGIIVSERWRSPLNFIEDMDPSYAKGLTLDRMDNDGNYTPENCRWATPLEQLNNTKRTIKVTHNGTTLTLTEWSKLTGIPRKTLESRYHDGRSIF